MKIKLAIFDMDGLLVDTEPLWQKAEIQTFEKIGINITPQQCKQYRGIRIDQVVRELYKIYKWKNYAIEQIVEQILQRMEILMRNNLQFLPGAIETIKLFKNKGIKTAIASSSTMKLINIVAQDKRIRNFIDFVHSGEFETKSKPQPDIFLTVANYFNILPEHTVVFEDSIPGIIAAKKAGMITVAVPENEQYHNKEFNIADFKIHTLKQVKKLPIFDEL